MALEPTVEEQELLADTFERDRTGLSRRELRASGLDTVAFVAVVGMLVLLRPPHDVPILPAALSALILVVATRVRFDTPFGFTVPIQLGFVPLLFSTPVALAPVAVAIALAIARLPDVLSGGVPSSRLLQTAGNSWFAIGPAAVFVIAGSEPSHAGAGLLLLALAAEFATDFAMSCLRNATARGAAFAAQLRELWVYGVDAALSGVALVVAQRVSGSPAVALSLLPILGLLALFAQERHQRMESLVELNSAYRGTALVLGDVVEADDGYTGEHCKSVVALALEVAETMGLSAEQRRNLEFAALLHDVGKIAIPKEIINKPGKLNPEEWTLIQTHTLEGERMLERVGGFMREVGAIVRSHHERWDGAGYPDGLVGDAIPLEARIVTCCDSWNAMRTNRSYRQALSLEVALAELSANSGSQFDPRVVDAFLGVVGPAGPADSRAAATEPIAASLPAASASAPGEEHRAPVPPEVAARGDS